MWKWAQGISLAIALYTSSATAQIAPDRTLGVESSVLNRNAVVDGLPAFLVEGGAVRRSNLFHSFRTFSTDQGQRVYFANPAGVQTIFTRVTGNAVSNLQGTLGVSGNADLYLINPNGLVFGPNASLDVNGSFVATTANAIQFGDRGVFSASPQAVSPLLTVAPSALLANQLTPGQITVRAIAPESGDRGGLQVPSGRNLLFVGGNIVLEGAAINSPGSYVGLVSLAHSGLLNVRAGTHLRLSAPGHRERSTVRISDSTIDVAADGGGEIESYARTLEIRNSALNAGMGAGQGAIGRQAGDIRFDGSSWVTVVASSIANQVAPGAVGDAGTIEVIADSLSLTEGAALLGSTFGQGNGANIQIHTSSSTRIDDIGVDGAPSRMFSRAEAGSRGNAGRVLIETGSLSLTDGGVISTSTFGRGDAGDISMRANVISFSGISRSGISSTAGANVFPGAVGNGGDISIETGSLFLSNSAQILSVTRGFGDSGNISIQASDRIEFDGNVFFSDATRQGRFPSGILNRVEPTGVGNAGNISIETGSLSLTNGGQIVSNTLGRGNAGNIVIRARGPVSVDGGSEADFPVASAVISAVGTTGVGNAGEIRIRAESVAVTNGGQIISSTLGNGNANNIMVTARDRILVDGGLPRNIFGSTIATAVQETGIGRGGNLRIRTGTLSLVKGGQLAAATVGRGDSGNIFVQARDRVLIDGIDVNGFSSGLFTSSEGTAENRSRGGTMTVQTPYFRVSNGALVSALTTTLGSGGNILVEADRFEALSGGQVVTATFGGGQAGTVRLNVTDQVRLLGRDPNYQNRIEQFGIDSLSNVGAESGLFANTAPGSTGNGGSILIDPEAVIVRDGAKISVDSQGLGRGGGIQLYANALILDQESRVSAETASNRGGDITLQLGDYLLLRRESAISTTAGTAQAGGDGGNLTINAPFLISPSQENSDITANAFSGRGGNIQISATGIFGLEFRPDLTDVSDITASSTFGIDGVVEIESPEVDPNRGVAELPVNLVDAAGLIDQDVCQGSDLGSEFVVTGRGGLPESPNEALTPETAWEDWRFGEETGQEVGSIPRPDRTAPGSPGLEAQGWAMSSDGNVTLTTAAITATPHDSWSPSVNCRSHPSTF